LKRLSKSHAATGAILQLDQYRFREAIPYLQRALAAVQLPEFYLGLGRAYIGLPDLAQTESTLKQGMTAIAAKNDD
jgi:hypothetical protein